MKKFIHELSKEELKKVFDANEKLQNYVLEDMIESEMFYIGEQLDFFSQALDDWSIDVYGYRNYIKINEAKVVEFIEGVNEMQKDYGLLEEEENSFLQEVIEKIDKYMCELEMYSDEYYELECEIINNAKEIAQMIVNHYNNIFEDILYNTKNQLQYFYDFYVDHRMAEDCYIIVNDDQNYTLYEDITINYAS